MTAFAPIKDITKMKIYKYLLLFIALLFAFTAYGQNYQNTHTSKTPKASFKHGVFVSESGEFEVTSPIEDYLFCIKHESDSNKAADTVGFRECHGYVQEHYMLSWYKLVESSTEEEFYKQTEKSHMLWLADNIFSPEAKGEITNSLRKVVNGKPAVEFDIKAKSENKQYRLRSTSILYGDRVLSISVFYDLNAKNSAHKPGTEYMFEKYNEFIKSFKRLKP